MTLFYIITAVRCSVCKAKNLPTIDEKTGKKMVQKFGFYRRKSDSKRIQRYKCLRCNHTFSEACKDPAYHQNKRWLNYKVFIGFTSLNSIRRMARTYHTTRKTIARKLEFLGICSKKKHRKELKTPAYQANHIQFDEIHTIEHTKCKPYVVSVAVCVESRKILGMVGATAPASGQGELKKAGKDPLFCINHTFAMLRANINRLIRKTWCTTKDPAMLMHCLLYTSDAADE